MIKKDNKGFTLVELLTVIGIIALITAIAVPSTLLINKNIQNKSVNAKVNLLLDSARNYALQKPNYIRKTIHTKTNSTECKSTNLIKDNSFNGGCECTDNKCEYVYIIKVKELITLGMYKAETNNAGSCQVSNPKDSSLCLDEHQIEIRLTEKNIASVKYLGKSENTEIEGGTGNGGSGNWCHTYFDDEYCYNTYDECELGYEEHADGEASNCYDKNADNDGTPGYCTNFMGADDFYSCFADQNYCYTIETHTIGSPNDCEYVENVYDLGEEIVWINWCYDTLDEFNLTYCFPDHDSCVAHRGEEDDRVCYYIGA